MNVASSRYAEEPPRRRCRRCRSKSVVRARKNKKRRPDHQDDPHVLPHPRAFPPRPPTLFEAYVATQNFLPRHEQAALFQCLRTPLPLHFRIRSQRAWDTFPPTARVRATGPPACFAVAADPCEWDAPFRAWWHLQSRTPGALSRQELVSLVPVWLLGVESHHAVLDLCASPGSKTTQAVDALYGNAMVDTPATNHNQKSQTRPTGFCVANEIDAKRAYILAHRCRETLQDRGASVAVTCHNATKFPNVLAPLVKEPKNASSSSSSLRPAQPYDRIICDVPCSGDGTLRKDSKVWHTWHPSYGMELHPLQVRVAKRGLALLKRGGIMTYSTCSFHPLENEAVVAALLATGCGQLVSAAPLLERANVRSLYHRSGLTQWKVLDDDLKEMDPTTDAPSTLWPPTDPHIAQELTKCVRLVPHDNDTGGFFIAVLQKVADFPVVVVRQTARPAAAAPAKLVTPPASHHQLSRMDHDDPNGDDDDDDNLVHFTRSPTGAQCSTYYAVSANLAAHLKEQVGSAKLNLVYAGFKNKRNKKLAPAAS
mmetsp:Transcript_35899/g.74654  ORF Transcript_35899/g.74654 Transcript_35899/m.74654 type:complete len:539 (-) Transcript_35899:901-2517(-)